LYSLLYAIFIILITRPGVGQEMIDMGWYQPAPYPYRGENLKWGYIDNRGIQVIHPQYDLAGTFQEGLASVKKGNRWGYINDEGKEIIPLEFEVAAPFSEGLAAVKKDGKWGYINAKGSRATDFLYEMVNSFSEDLAAIKKDGKWGYIDTKGKKIIDYKYDIADNFSEGIAGIEIGGKWGYIDTSGKEVIKPQFDLANPFTEHLACVEIAGKWGYINKTGSFAIPAQYDTARPFSEGLASVLIHDDNSIGLDSVFIDRSGEHILKWSNAMAGSFHNGKALLFTENRTYLIDKTGNKIKQFGQSRINVQLDSEPAKATAYMIPLYDWEINGGEELLQNRLKLNKWRVPEGLTAVKTTAERKVYEVVFFLREKRDHVPLDVFPGNPNKAKGFPK
jgi:hypothetical protein